MMVVYIVLASSGRRHVVFLLMFCSSCTTHVTFHKEFPGKSKIRAYFEGLDESGKEKCSIYMDGTRMRVNFFTLQIHTKTQIPCGRSEVWIRSEKSATETKYYFQKRISSNHSRNRKNPFPTHQVRP